MFARLIPIALLATVSAGCASCSEPEETPNNNDPVIFTEDDLGTQDAGTDGDFGEGDMNEVTVDMAPAPPPPVLSVGSESLVLRTGERQQLEAVVEFEGEEFEPEELTWLSGDESIVTVSPEGLVTAQMTEGATNIIASATFMGADLELTLPTTVVTPYIEVAAGGAHSCALTRGGSLFCWGANDVAQGAVAALNALDQPTGGPLAVSLIGVAAGRSHSCGYDVDGMVWCWGQNDERQAGSAAGGVVDEPSAVGLADIDQLALGDAFTCARETLSPFQPELGALYCWGSNEFGQLGSTVATSTEMPTRVDVSGPTQWKVVVAGRTHACGVTQSNETYCWGDNSADQLGPQPGVAQSDAPLLVGSSYTTIGAGGDQSCGVTAAGVVECWGTSAGGLAPGITNSADPVVVPSPGDERAGAVFVGDDFACAETGSSTFCWGNNDRGQLADTTTESRDTTADVNGSPSYQQLSVGGAHACALSATGGVFCWGANDEGQVGDGSGVDRRSPVLVALPRQTR